MKRCFKVIQRGVASEMVKWKTGLSCRSLTVAISNSASKLILAWKQV
jgi:hypothetical protein